MKTLLFLLTLSLMLNNIKAKDNYTNIIIDSKITNVQPMTGIVLWTTNSHNKTDAVSLEYSYMLFNDVVDENGSYNWQVVENKLNDIASRSHQAIFRFRYVYPGYKTAVPDYIKNLPDYNETKGKSEGLTTWFPDWSHNELQKFTLNFYTKLAERYDNDPRLAFIQVGFGLWGEYHIYDDFSYFKLGKTFPSKDFQTHFFEHLDTTFINIPYSISIDAADDTYSPFSTNETVKNTGFGLFDDSFMHQNHSGYNTECWNFFNRNRYKYAPAGGEFSYYTDYDQEHVLDPNGNFGESFESFASRFHISYMIGNDQTDYQTLARIKEASMSSGYKFKIVSCKANADSTILEIKNIGVAPIYYDAYPSVNGIKAEKSLKFLQPGELKTYKIGIGGSNPDITIKCDKLVNGQTIQYEGTIDYSSINNKKKNDSNIKIYPSIINDENTLNIEINYQINKTTQIYIFNLLGEKVYTQPINSNITQINTCELSKGLYIIAILENSRNIFTQKISKQ